MSRHDEERDEALTPAEARAFAELPREREPGSLLEERTVRALRTRELLREAPPRAARRLRFPAAWISGAIAAGIALFLGGLATGQYLGGRQADRMLSQIQRRDAQQAALMVQQTGSAYLQALSQFAQVADTSRGAQSAQGREVASRMLRAAANEVVKLNPNDPVASGILAAFDRAAPAPGAAPRDTAARQNVVWF